MTSSRHSHPLSLVHAPSRTGSRAAPRALWPILAKIQAKALTKVAVGCGLVLGLGMPCAVWASPPAEKMVCTDAPRSAWMSEQKARDLFKAADYVLVQFKVSRGNCYEFYAIDHQNNVVEAYMHPISGQMERKTSIAAPAPSAPTAAPEHSPQR